MKSKMFFLVLAMFVMATPIFAQEAAGTGGGGSAINITSGIAMALASGLCALAQGRALGSSAEAIARNPGAGNVIRGALILGLAFIESLALFTFVVIAAKF
ncbi:MAG TPA: ATP synthase F0 subunit C [Bryobacteraceae bacterium]|nr:ATP synthase F0 subunit C [Bryobacteraceae bacterium]